MCFMLGVNMPMIKEVTDIEELEENKKLTPQELAAKLDAELDEFINGLEKKAYTEGWPEDRWEEVNFENKN